MLSYIVRRIAAMIPILLLVSIVIFLFIRILPGDPARLVAGEDASAETVALVRAELGLDQPIVRQYLIYMGKLFQGDFGYSYRSHKPVAELMANRIVPTAQLAFSALIWAALVGIPLGVFSAINRGRWLDRSIMVVSVSGISIPAFWLGILLVQFFCVRWGLLPSGGYGGVRNIVLPSLTLGAHVVATMARFGRNSLLETLRQDYVRTARAKGAREWQVILKHALRNALIPIVTMSAMQLGFMLGGSVVVESVFAWPGVGRLLIASVTERDYPVIQACMLLFSFTFLFINMVSDLMYAIINPQIRLDS